MTDIDTFKSKVRVSDIIGKTVKLQRKGHEHIGLCPFHEEKTPSFTVSDDKGFFHCFGCQKNGDVIDFVMETEGLEFRDAVEAIADRAGIDAPTFANQGPDLGPLYDANEAACVWFQEQLLAERGDAARSYLEGRGIGVDLIKRFRIGFAPDGRWEMSHELGKRGIAKDALVASGLAVQLDQGGTVVRFRNRITFPVMDRRGRVVGFSARDLSGSHKAKYLNTNSTPIFDKGRLLYGLSLIKRGGEVVLVEGATDAIAFSKAGLDIGVATLGTACTADQLMELWAVTDEPSICLDGDEAGLRAGRKIIDTALPHLRPGKSLKFVRMPAGMDPDSLIERDGAAALSRQLEQAIPLMDFLWKFESRGISEQPEQRAALRARLNEAIRPIPDQATRQAFWYDIAERWKRLLSGKSKPVSFLAAPTDMGEAALLGVVLACPALLGDVAEELEALSLNDPRLATCAAAIADWGMNGMADVIGLREHLIVAGHADVLKAIEITPAFRSLRGTTDLVAAKARWDEALAFVVEKAERRITIEALRQAIAEDDEERISILMTRKAQMDGLHA